MEKLRRRILAASLALAAAVSFSPMRALAQQSAADADPEVMVVLPQVVEGPLKELRDQMIEAYGGEAVLRGLLEGPLRYDLALRVHKVKSDENAEVNCSLVTHGKDRFWLKIKGGTREIAVGFDGKTVWAKAGAHVLSNDEEGSRMLIKQAAQKHGELT
ncbi:MAG: hypothetical protein ACRD3W_32545, partial [Terriglobales bacterium]